MQVWKFKIYNQEVLRVEDLRGTYFSLVPFMNHSKIFDITRIDANY